MFQRPRSLTDDEKGATLDPPRSKCCVPAPSVLVFNQSGEVAKSWGGPGDNLGYDWPSHEHGILVDNKGFVWLSGNGKTDMMVLKFTTDGKFIAEIGKSGPLTSSTDLTQFGQVAALEYDKGANEIYAADGYGNHRVAVLDGDTGAIKRVWGAYGKPPTDDKLPPYDPDARNSPTRYIVSRSAKTVSFTSATTPTIGCRCSKHGNFVRQFVFEPKTQGTRLGVGSRILAARQEDKISRSDRRNNNVIETVRRKDGAVVGTYGCPRTRRRRISLGSRRQVQPAMQTFCG